MNPKDSVGAKKAPLGVVPPALILGAAPAMAVGANKYGPFNWRAQPVQAMTYVEAIMRHLLAWVDGQEVAEDTGVSHFGHAAAGLGILMDAQAMGNLLDNRPPKGPAADMLRAQDKSAKMNEPLILKDSGPPVWNPGDPIPHQDPGSTEACFEEHDLPDYARLVYGLIQRQKQRDLTAERAAVELRGEYPVDTRIAGRLTCCGATEHTLDCPNYRA